MFLLVHHTGRNIVDIGARADKQDDDEEKRLEVEEGGLDSVSYLGRLTLWESVYHDEA